MSPSDTKPMFVGKLADMPFPKLLNEVCSMGISGTLTLVRGKVKKDLFLDHGRPTKITSNLLQEVLGRYLVTVGKITEQQYQDTLATAFNAHRLHGDVLIEQGLLTGDELGNYLRDQSLAKLLNLFKWTEGEYLFFKGDSKLQRNDFQSLTSEAIILMGIRKYYGLDRLVQLIEPYRMHYLYPGSKRANFKKTGDKNLDEEWLLNLADGTKTVTEIIEASPFEYIDSYRIIYGAIVTDILSIKDSPAVQSVGVRDAVSDHDASARMVATYHEMATKNYFEVLNVDETASGQEIKHAYLKLAKEYHPDSLGPETLPLVEKTANQIFDLVTKAYKVLTNDEARENYIHSLNRSPGEVTVEKAHDIMNAELLFQKGKIFLRKRDYTGARESFEWAAKLMPDEGEYLAYLGWTLFLSVTDKKGPEALTAIKYLKKAAMLNPSIEVVHLFLGAIYKTQNLRDIAALHFKKALEVNPESVEARRELSALGPLKARENNGTFFGNKTR